MLNNDYKRPGHRVTYHINFAGTNYRLNSAWRPLSLKNKYKVISAVVRGKKPEAVKIVGETVLEPYGLYGLNREFILYCGMEIVEALKVMSVAEHYPLLVHCTQGKDRTGLICAMALHVCGAGDREIIMATTGHKEVSTAREKSWLQR